MSLGSWPEKILWHSRWSWDGGENRLSSKGQLNSEWIYEFIVSPKKQTKNYEDFCPTIQTKTVAPFFGDSLVNVGSFFGYDPCLFGRAEILVILVLHFWGNDDLISSFWIWLTFSCERPKFKSSCNAFLVEYRFVIVYFWSYRCCCLLWLSSGSQGKRQSV